MRPNCMLRRSITLLASFALSVVALAQSGQAPNPHRQAALQFEREGKLAEATNEWSALQKAHPRDPEPYAHLGLIASRQGRYKDAVPFYRKALAIYPNVPGLRLDLGLALFKSAQLKESIPEFEILLKKTPANSPQAQRLNTLIGMAHYGIGEYAKAAPYLKAAATQDSQNLQLRLALAHSYLWARQFKEVLLVYHEILAINPNSAEADMLAGEALDEMKDSAGAIKMFREAARANPKEPNVHFGLGYLLWVEKNYAEAATEFQAELNNDPGHAASMAYLADSDMQLNKAEAAKPLLEHALQLEPDYPLAHLDLGIIYANAGRNEDALRELLAAEKLLPNDVNVHWRLGRLYRAMGKTTEAKAELQKASALNKKVNDELYRMIANGAKRGEKGETPSESAPPANTTDSPKP